MKKSNEDRYRKLHVKHQRMRSRTEGIRIMNRYTFCILLIMLSVIVPVTAIPQLLKARAMQQEYEGHWNEQMQKSKDKLDELERERKAIVEDSVYLEYKARERLGWSKEGEKILVFPEDKRR